MLLEMVTRMTEGYFLRQLMTIVLIYILGNVLVLLSGDEMKVRERILFAFPLGLALFSVTGAFLLMTGIVFNSLTATAAPIAAIFLTAVLTMLKRKSVGRIKVDRAELMAIPAVLIIAAVATSGFLSLNVSNDSVYYYSTFPAMLVKSGAYAKSFDTYLTNVGQTSAVINCIPFLYGFDTTFGIQHFMNINFLLIFADILYDEAFERLKCRKASVLAALMGSVFLATSTPFLIISKWVLSNVYFMEYGFILFALIKKDRSEKSSFDLKIFLLFALMTMLRQEGTVLVLLLAVAASSFDYTNKKLALNFILPVFLIEALYYMMLFLRLGVDPLYSFLDWKKAIAVLGSSVIVGIYLLLIRGKIFRPISSNINMMLIAAAAAGNLLILAASHSRYLTNLYAFYQNIRLGNGWGYFGFFLAAAGLLVIYELISGKFRDISYETAYIAAMIMVTVIVAWARGGSLVVRTSDSGNRILLQCVPFIVYYLSIYLLSFVKKVRDADETVSV